MLTKQRISARAGAFADRCDARQAVFYKCKQRKSPGGWSTTAFANFNCHRCFYPTMTWRKLVSRATTQHADKNAQICQSGNPLHRHAETDLTRKVSTFRECCGLESEHSSPQLHLISAAGLFSA